MFYRTKNNKTSQRKQIFAICKKSIQEIWKTIIEYCCYKRTRCTKNCLQKSSRLVHKPTEATSELIGNKITDKIEKPKPVSDKEKKVLKQ